MLLNRKYTMYGVFYMVILRQLSLPLCGKTPTFFTPSTLSPLSPSSMYSLPPSLNGFTITFQMRWEERKKGSRLRVRVLPAAKETSIDGVYLTLFQVPEVVVSKFDKTMLWLSMVSTHNTTSSAKQNGMAFTFQFQRMF
ncbi:unnamed protein product, partial [Linum tenue]